MYIGAKTVVRTVYGNSKRFEVKVGMHRHQGSGLSPLLFVIVMEAISREFTVSLITQYNLRMRVGARYTHTTDRKYYTAYLFVPFPITLDDLEGHWPNTGLIKCNSTNICLTFSTVLTVMACHAVPRR